MRNVVYKYKWLINSNPSWAPDIGLKWRDPFQLIRTALNLAILVVIIVAVFMVVYNGFKLVLSGGKEDKVDEAKRGILYAFIGILVAVAAYVVVAIVFKFLTGKSITEAFRFF